MYARLPRRLTAASTARACRSRPDTAATSCARRRGFACTCAAASSSWSQRCRPCRPRRPASRSPRATAARRRSRRARSALQQREHFSRLRESLHLALGEHELPVPQDVELARAPRRGLDLETLFVQPGRETRGPFVVAASGGAIKDLDAHAAKPNRGIDSAVERTTMTETG